MQAALRKVEEYKAFLAADYKYKKDLYANFAYYNAFADAIQAHRWSDPRWDIAAMVICGDNPPDLTHLLEVHDLANPPLILLRSRAGCFFLRVRLEGGC